MLDENGDVLPYQSLPDNLADDIDQLLTVAEAEGIGFTQGLTDNNVVLIGALVGPDKYVTKQLNSIHFVDPEHARNVDAVWNAYEGEGTEIIADERDISRQAGDPLVNILKGLEVRQVNHHEKRLLKGILYSRGNV